MEIKRILWPTDMSRNAAQALPYVASLSEKYGAEVHLIFVVEDVHQFDHFYGDASPAFLKEFQGKIIEKGEQYLDRICRDNLAGCPLYKKHIAVGDPAQEILKFIGEGNMDVVVMATHGHGEESGEGLRHYPFGSVSEKVIRNSRVPVLAINPLTGEKTS